MRKIYSLSCFCLLLLISVSGFSQTEYNMSNNFVTDCEGILFDSGGFFGDYGDSEDFTFTICPDNPPTCLQMEFDESSLEGGADFISFFDGPDINSPLIGIYTGEIPAQIGASSGCITIRFFSDNSTTDLGWVATWVCSEEECASPPPPVPSPQDCINAIPICQDVYFEQDAYQGVGNVSDEIDPLESCLASGEMNDVWYVFTVQTAGELAFSITPNDLLDDYDWAVFNLTTAACTDINDDFGLQVSCNYSGDAGVTGPTGASTFNNQDAGGTNQNATIPVQVGETYVINVSQFSTSTNGYTIDFSESTAEIFDMSPPQVTTVDLPVECGESTITISLSENVICDEVTPESFIIEGPNGPYTISSILGQSCAIGGEYDNLFELQISPMPTTSGMYTLSSDLAFNDLCGNASDPIAPMSFTLACQAALAGISGTVWSDLNGNGVQDAGEPGLPNIVVNLYGSDGTTLLITVMTNADGTYSFVDLMSGDYTVIVGSGPNESIISTQEAYTYTLGEGANEGGANFGYQPISCTASAGTLDESTVDDFYCNEFNGNISVSSTGFEAGADYAQVYVLTNDDSNLTIVAVNTTGSFATPNSGSYIPHALNVLAEEAPTNLNELVGQSAVLVSMTLDCFDLVSGTAFTVLSAVSVSVDYECDAEAGISTLAVSFTGGYAQYAAANGLSGAEYEVSGDLSGSYAGGEDILLSNTDNSAYAITAVDAQGCSGSVSGTPPPCIKVAIELLDFYGRVADNGNQLYWSTASETNSAVFMIERSVDGNNFKNIGTVAAAGNSNTTQNYEFLDSEAPNTIAYYRLVEKDIDGKETPSSIITLERQSEISVLSISPIPANNFIQVRFSTIVEMPIVQVYDEAGRLVELYAQDISIVKDEMTIRINDLPKGIYFITIQANNQLMTEKFVKQ